MKTAKRAAQLIKKFIKLQPDPENLFYYTMDQGALDTEPDSRLNMVFVVNRTRTTGFYMHLSIPAAFLASYYRATGKEVYLKLAKNLLYFLGSCHENIYALKTATQKFAVAASLVGTITGDRDINAMAERASAFLLDGLNEDGTFFDPAIRSPLVSEEVPLTLRLVDSTT